MAEKKESLAVQSATAGHIAVLRPQTIGEAMELATILAKSTLVPNEYRGKPENVLVAMQLGAEVGLSPFQALQSVAVINGKPSVYGDAGLAIVQASGLLEDMDESDDEATKTATCWMKRKHGRRVERSFSHADAERITMYERDSNNNTRQTRLADRTTWKSFPKRMRQMRSRWWVMRDLFPDVLKGMQGREEFEPGASPFGPGEVIEATDDYQDLMPKEKGGTVETAAVVVEEERVVPPKSVAEAFAGSPQPEPKSAPVVVVETDGQAVIPGTLPAATSDNGLPPLKVVEEYTVSFEMNGTQYMTNGISKEQLKETFRLAPQVDRKSGKGTASKLLRREFAYEHRVDLTSEEAERYLVRLREILEP